MKEALYKITMSTIPFIENSRKGNANWWQKQTTGQ
jgi:hypothetical protein